jgi:hypothetical protein
MQSSRSRPAKRQRTQAFGAPTEDDDVPVKLTYNTFSDSTSTRSVAMNFPSLATLCARVFVKHIQQLSSDPTIWDPTREWLKLIPDAVIPKLFAMLRTSCPNILSHAFITVVWA